MKISASFLGVKNIPKFLTELNVTDVDYIHVDVMDGKYTINKTMPYNELKAISNYTRKRLDVHLMVEHPLKFIDDYATLNVEYLSVQIDSKDNLDKVFSRLHDYGIKVGLAISPKDDIELLKPYLKKIDLVLVLAVTPGFPGQDFQKSTLSRINALKDEIKREKLKTLISVDGGVTIPNSKYLKDVDIIVSGTTISNSENLQETITKLRK